MKKCHRDIYWNEVKRIHLIQYLSVLIFLVIAYICFSSYIFPTFDKCRKFTLHNQTFQSDNFTKIVIQEVQTNLEISDDIEEIKSYQVLQEFGAQTLNFTRYDSYCANLHIKLNQTQPNLAVDVDYLSPLRLKINKKQFTKLDILSPHFAGYNNITASNIDALKINTESTINITNSTMNTAEFLNAIRIDIINTTIRNQTVVVGGPYQYVQLENDPIKLNLSINSAGLHERHRVCIPRQAVEKQCIQVQNKYWTGNVGVKYYANQSLVEQITRFESKHGSLLYGHNVGEITQVCVNTSVWNEDTSIKIFNY